MKPNFFVIGSAKCATTSLCSLLGRHPQVFMSEPKEPSFFSDDEAYARGLTEYEALFSNAGGVPLRGEGSTRYTVRDVYPNAAKRLAQYAPDAKLIYIVRHPMRRIEAAWMEIRSWGDRLDTTVHPSFNRSVRRDRAWLVDSANYLREIELYRQHYSDEQILVLFFEEFKQDANAIVERCLDFLGADAKLPLSEGEQHLNPSAGKTAPGAVLRLVHSQAWLRRLVHLVPASARSFIGEKYLTTEMNERPAWNAATRQWVIELLQADTQAFLERYGKTADYWPLEQ